LLLGATSGYGIWLVTATLIVVLTPVDNWAVSATIALAAVTSTAFLLARHQPDRDRAIACWVAPSLPALTSACLLIGPALFAVGISA
jgi:hypothetical protein